MKVVCLWKLHSVNVKVVFVIGQWMSAGSVRVLHFSVSPVHTAMMPSGRGCNVDGESLCCSGGLLPGNDSCLACDCVVFRPLALPTT